MPMYEYLCEKCGSTTEALRAMSQADAKMACEKCGSEQTHRKLSTFSAAVAGGGSNGGGLPMGGCCPCGKNQGSCSSM